MTGTTAVIGILAGIAAEVIAVVNKHFYWKHSNKEAPLWFGRLLFGGMGVLFILVGIRYFVLGY